MNYNQCKRLLAELPRYQDWDVKRRNRRGLYHRQVLIPLCSRAEADEAQRICATRKLHPARVRWIRVDKLKSEQRALSKRRLTYALNHFVKLQTAEGEKLPYVVDLGGSNYILWDGNHRCTIAVLSGVEKVRCLVIRRRIPKKALTGWVNYG